MPADQRFRLDDDESVLPVAESAEQDHDQLGGLVGAPWALLPFEKETELAAQEEILRYELLMGAEETQVLDREGDG